MIKIREDIDLKELEKMGFTKYEKSNCYSRCYGTNYITQIDIATREIIKVDIEYGFNEMKKYHNSMYKISDLQEAGMIEIYDETLN